MKAQMARSEAEWADRYETLERSLERQENETLLDVAQQGTSLDELQVKYGTLMAKQAQTDFLGNKEIGASPDDMETRAEKVNEANKVKVARTPGALGALVSVVCDERVMGKAIAGAAKKALSERPETKAKLCGLNEDKRKAAEGVPEWLVVTLASEHALDEKLGLEESRPA